MIMLKKNFNVILLLLIFLIPCHSQIFAEQDIQPRKTVDKLVKKIIAVRPYHSKLSDDIARGFEKACNCYKIIKTIEAFVKDKKNVYRRNDIVPQIRASEPDLILAMGEEVLAELKVIDDIPIVYTYVPDIPAQVSERKNITGLGNMLSPEKQLSVIRQALPDKKIRLGVVYEVDKAKNFIKRAKKAASQNDIRLVTAKIITPYESKKNDDSVWDMLKKANTVWVVPDSAIHQSWISVIISLQCIKKRMPMFTFTENMIDGEFMSLCTDGFDVGLQAGAIAIRILLFDDKPGNIPKADPRKGNITINTDIARLMGIKTDKKITLPDGWTLQHKRYEDSFRRVRNIW